MFLPFYNLKTTGGLLDHEKSVFEQYWGKLLVVTASSFLKCISSPF